MKLELEVKIPREAWKDPVISKLFGAYKPLDEIEILRSIKSKNPRYERLLEVLEKESPITLDDLMVKARIPSHQRTLVMAHLGRSLTSVGVKPYTKITRKGETYYEWKQ